MLVPIHENVLSQGILMWNIKALAFIVLDKVSDRMADKTKNIIPPIVQFTHYLKYRL